ncbi:hypothetical protein GCM10011507_13720 [Edaphobacter acidisoli]|uniref:DUF3592 domain-containing protein n=1 Tax=Edaphobacter acidisoli TaxID=2040573 RepID=A0A916RNP2_9BACT|nr:hypothetical protein [Edaphobacter acidisoli]GGA63324.1 hypothetical protein GCM10011507_13720 [Edaphobacter acidisoli]
MKPPKIPWLETQAKVTACKYEFGAGQALAFGIPRSKHFRIAFSYRAHGQTYTGEFTSPTYIEQGATFPIAYNPLAPQENSKTAATPVTKTSLFAIGVIGSIVLSLLWLALLRGCS